MRILFDQGTPVPLRKALAAHTVETAFERGWGSLLNGQLLDAAQREGFDVFITTDQSLRSQQNLDGRQIAIVVLTTTSWPRIQRQQDRVVAAIDGLRSGDYIELSFSR